MMFRLLQSAAAAAASGGGAEGGLAFVAPAPQRFLVGARGRGQSSQRASAPTPVDVVVAEPTAQRRRLEADALRAGAGMGAGTLVGVSAVAGLLVGIGAHRGPTRQGRRRAGVRRAVFWGSEGRSQREGGDVGEDYQEEAAESSVAPPLRLPLLSEEDRLELSRGRPVQKQERQGNKGWGFVAVEVDAPPQLVFRCLESFEDYDGMIPVVRDAKVLSRTQPDANGVSHARCQYRVSRFFLGISAVHRVDRQARIVRFDLDPSVAGMVLREASGFWHVEPLPGPGGASDGSRCRVWLRVGLRASSLLPHCLLEYAADRALRRATSWLKPHMEELWQREQMLLQARLLSAMRVGWLSPQPLLRTA